VAAALLGAALLKTLSPGHTSPGGLLVKCRKLYHNYPWYSLMIYDILKFRYKGSMSLDGRLGGGIGSLPPLLWGRIEVGGRDCQAS
jgi:hypothetical protein